MEQPAPAAATETVDEEAARKREAADFAERMRAAGKQPARVAPARVEIAPRAEAAPTEIPEKLREPVGTNTFGVETPEVIRGPQGMLFPMSKREEMEYAKSKEAQRVTEEQAPATAERDERQRELDFTAKEAPAEVSETVTPTDAEMLRAVENRPLLEVAQWAAQNLPYRDQKVIAQRILVKLRQLQELGAELKPIKVTKEGYSLTSGAMGTTIYSRKTKPSSIEITLNHPSNGDQSGVTPEVILHELLHAATLGTIEMGRYKSAEGTKVGTATRELIDLTNAIITQFNEKIARGDTLTPFEERIHSGRNNALKNSHEVLVWSLTNRDMQQYMESIPYKGTTAWNKFVTFIRDLLGIPAKADTALSEALRLGDTLLGMTKEDIRGAEMQTGKQFAISYSTEQLVDSMGPLEGPQRSALRSLIQGVQTTDAITPVTKFRTQVADIAASIEQRLHKRFDGAVRDSLGKLNPMGLYRQAQDYTKMLLEYFQQGSIAKNTTTGLWEVTTDRDVNAPAKVYDMLSAWGKKNGYSFDRATQIASRVLEGVRLNEMREANRTQGTNFLLHLSDNEIDQLVAEYRADPDLKALSDAMDAPRKALVDKMVEAGRLSPEMGKQWKDVIGYVPFDRIDDFESKFNKIKKVSGRGIAQLGKLPELVGSKERPVGNVFDNYLNTLGWMVGQTLKNDAALTTLRTLQDMQHAKFLGYTTQGQENTASAYENGEQKFWLLPSKYDVLAFKDLLPPKAGYIKLLGQASSILRTTVTALPPFALKQVTDDIQRAILTSGVKSPMALVRMSLTNFPKLALAELRGIRHPIVKDAEAMGFSGAFDFIQGKPAASLLADMGYKPRGLFREALHRLEGITRASDLAVRKAIYDQTIKEGGDQLLAQTRAREFINFRRRGANNFVGDMVATVPFFNAYVQGMDVLYRAASGIDSSSSVARAQARKLFWNRAATVVALSTLYALGKDDDDEQYKEADLRTRDNNWFIGGMKLSVPGELGALFKVIPERVVEYMKRQGTPEEQEAWEATRTALTYMYEQYVGRTIPIPQAAKPLFEAWTNYSFLTGRPLEGIYQKAMLPSQRRSETTSELALAISKFSKDMVGVEVSPIMVDNTLRGYFGSTAAMTTMLTDSLLNPTRVDRPLHKWALLSNYMVDPVGTRRLGEFYETREKVGQLHTTLNELAKTDIAAAEAFAEKHAGALAMNTYINATLEQLEQTRAYRKYLNSPDGAAEMSKAEREREIEEIRRTEVELVSWLREAKAMMRNEYR